MRPSLADLEALAAEAEDLPGIVLEYEPLHKCGPRLLFAYHISMSYQGMRVRR